MSTNYRSEEEGLSQRLAQQQERLAREQEQASRLRGLYQRRVARSVAGLVGTLCGLAVFLSGLLVDRGDFFGEEGDWFEGIVPELLPSEVGVSTQLLLLAPCVALLVYILALGAAKLKFSRRIQKKRSPEQDLQWEVESLSALSPLTEAQALVNKALFQSLAWPLVALSLLGPLSLHFVVSLLHDGWEAYGWFHEWIRLSAMIVSQSHVVLVGSCLLLVRDLCATKLEHLQPLKKRWVKSLMYTSFSSFLPGIFFSMALVLITGLFLIPAMFYWAISVYQREQLLLKPQS